MEPQPKPIDHELHHIARVLLEELGIPRPYDDDVAVVVGAFERVIADRTPAKEAVK